MKTLKNHIGFIAFFSLTIAAFLYPLITMRSVFLWGDSSLQFFPWFKCYSEAIKSFSFPYWIRSMGGGFPLMAEGQVGGFYPFNILFFFIMPFKVAYNYSVIFHFIIAGIFTYLYTRRLGADQAGGYLAALLFCFGSAYAGCFYNIITLRTLAWFPLALLLIEYYFDKGELKYIFLNGIILGIQFLAGFVQVALYSAFFYLAYFIYKAVANRVGTKNALIPLSILLITSVVIALPQLALTYQLAGFSSRENATLGFALWGSVFPSDLLGLVFPRSFYFKSNLYVGILSLLFAIFSLYSLKKDKASRPLALVLILSIFLALGGYNPVYVALLKITKLYMFRNPSKFLFFGAFSLSVLAGTGLTGFFASDDAKNKKSAVSAFRIILVIAGVLFFAAKFLLFFFKDTIIRLGCRYVNNFIYNKPHHIYSLEYYMDKARSSYDVFLNNFSFSNAFVILSWAMFIAAFLFCLLLLRKRSKQIAILLIFIDIFSFYGTGFSGYINPFTYLIPTSQKIFERLKSDHDVYRILPFDIKSKKLPNWSLPNANITYGIDSVACYTPLANKIYRNKLSGLEVIDNSLGLKNSNEDAIKNNIDILKLLNVKYIVAQKLLAEEFLEKVDTENGTFLYKLKDYFPRLFFSYSITSEIKQAPLKDFKIIAYKNGFIEAEMTTDKDGFVVFSENYYPGWRVFIDEKEGKIIKVKDILQGVSVGKGHHKVVFVYKPQFLLLKR